MRLCASRAVYTRANSRETQEMVFDAHACGFAFFGGVPLRGIYDNMKTPVTSVFVGKERVFNRRFLVTADHYMSSPRPALRPRVGRRAKSKITFRRSAGVSSNLGCASPAWKS